MGSRANPLEHLANVGTTTRTHGRHQLSRQSAIFGFIFYGFGFGLFGQLSVSAALAIGTAVYASQVLLSQYWLRHFRFGPIEWIWRSAMYGQWQPLNYRG